MKIVRLENDSDGMDPCDCDFAWKVYSFSNRHGSYKNPEYFFTDGEPNDELKEKLENGMAFLLDYFEHGNCVWSLKGSGPECRFDTSHNAGLIVWEHPEGELGMDYLGRRMSAEKFIELYTMWCNGEVYGYVVTEVHKCGECGHIVEDSKEDSCWGFYGNDVDFMAEQVRGIVKGDKDVTFEGEAKFLADYHDFIGKPDEKAGEVKP